MGRLKDLALGCLVATLLFVAGPTRAATLAIEFDLSASTSAVVVNPNVLTAPLEASGKLTLTFTGVGSDGSLLGSSQAVLSGLRLTASSISTIQMVPEFSAITSDSLTQTGTALGQFDGTRVVFDPGQIAGQHDASDMCQGAICALIFSFERPDGPFANQGPFAIELASLGMPGSAMLRGQTRFPFVGGVPQIGQTILLLRGTEIRRTVVPEPSSVGLLALAGLAAAALRRSRRAV